MPLDVKVWEGFIMKVEDMFAVGYKLPEIYHTHAVKHIEGKVCVWKGKIALGNGKQVPMVRDGFDDSNHGNQSELELCHQTLEDKSLVTMEQYQVETSIPAAGEADGTQMDVASLPVNPADLDPDYDGDTDCCESGSSSDDDTKDTIIANANMSGGESEGHTRQDLDETQPDDAVVKTEALSETGSARVKRRLVCKTRRKFKCRQCVKAFKTQKSLGLHTQKFHKVLGEESDEFKSDRNTFFSHRKCPHCAKVYTSHSGYAYHIKKHKADQTTGTDGKTESNTATSDADSPAATRSRAVRRKCPHCPKIYNSSSGYSSHMKKHASFKCSDCEHLASSQAELYTHMDTVHAQFSGDFACQKCENCFMTEPELQNHISRMGHYPIHCFFCSKKFFSICGYRVHRRLHTGEGLQCPECDYIAGNQTGLRIHTRKTHLRIRDYLCDICARSFPSRNSLNEHTIAAHMREQYKDRFKCEECPFMTHNRFSLRMHIRNLHQENPGFMCHLCGTTLTSKTSLDSHQQRHQTKMIFSCNECLFKANCKDNLLKHVRRKHRMEAKEECEYCKKKFKSKSHLRRHQVIHTGQKEFSCPHCAYQCNVKSNLGKHIVNVHKQKPARIRPVILKVHEDGTPGTDDTSVPGDVVESDHAEHVQLASNPQDQYVELQPVVFVPQQGPATAPSQYQQFW